MENYEIQLLELRTKELSTPKSHISYNHLATLASIESSKEYEKEIYRLAKHLPMQISNWPSFGEYTEDWYNVEINGLKNQLQYCERGSYDIRKDCENQIDLCFYILHVVLSGFTPSALEISQNLDRIKDQRILIWLRMSSEIYFMFQVNQFFGKRVLIKNITWMCQELVRMGVFKTTSEALDSEKHIIKGLCLSGLPDLMAKELYQELKYA